MDSNLHWYALEVAYKKEESVALALSQKGYATYVPLYDLRKVWSDRIRKITVPLFSGYVFCQFDVNSRWLPVVLTPSVRQVVSVGRVPAAIPDCEIDGIRAVISSGIPIEPTAQLKQGSRVLVMRGPFAGVEGSFLREQGRDRLIVSISCIQRSVLVEIDSACVEPIKETRFECQGPRVDPLKTVVVQ